MMAQIAMYRDHLYQEVGRLVERIVNLETTHQDHLQTQLRPR